MFKPLTILCAMMVMAFGVQAEADLVTASADTSVTEHWGLGGPASIHGTDSTMGIIGASGSRITPLVKFDLSEYSGQTVTGDAVLRLHLDSSWQNAKCTQVIEVHASQSAWNESTTSWTNLPGPYGSIDSTVLDSQTVTWNSTAGYIPWTIPGSLVQSWIDAPTTNHGLVLVSLTTPNYEDLWFSSREGSYAPQLVFSTVPEPSAFALCGIGALSLLAFAWRYRG